MDHTTKCSLESKSLQLAAAVPAAVMLLRITGCSGSETHNSGIGRSGATTEDDSNLLKSGPTSSHTNADERHVELRGLF